MNQEGADEAFKGAGKKLDMGKCCVHFESPGDLPLEAIGKLISAISSEKWIEMYEQSRLMTKAGQAQMAKQGAPSASKVAAKRVDTNWQSAAPEYRKGIDRDVRTSYRKRCRTYRGSRPRMSASPGCWWMRHTTEVSL